MKGLSLIPRSLAFFVGVVLFLVGGFYLEEDLRGAHEWQIAQTRLLQAGNTLNFKDLRPPEIPDEQNLGALPLFKWRKAQQGSFDLASDPLEKALENILPILAWSPPPVARFNLHPSGMDCVCTRGRALNSPSCNKCCEKSTFFQVFN